MFRTALISMFLTSTALATTWTVDDDGKADFDNIQAAVDASSDGDEIVVMPGIYTSTGGKVVNPYGKEVWIHSSEGPEVTVIDGEGARRGIVCVNNETSNTHIEGFTITNGWTNTSGGGMYSAYGSPTLTNCIFTNNTAGENGGGMFNSDCSPTLIGCTFSSNSTVYAGGGMHNTSSSNPTLTNCTFTSNSAGTYGGGMESEASTPALTGCTLCGNTPDQISGAWYDKGGNTIENTCVIDDADEDGITDDIDNCYLYNPDQADCNNNGIGDICDIADFTSYDCDQDSVPDECQPDCDGDGWIDACDSEGDCDDDGIPDNCETDCNENGIPDDCDIIYGISEDCNENGIPDECDIENGSTATAVDAIDTTGYTSSGADASFTIAIPASAGGLSGSGVSTAVNAIDTTGYTSSGADASFTILIPTSAGGLGGTAVTILLDEDKDDVTQASPAANTITIGTLDASETDAMAASFLINAINGVSAGRFIYASSGNGEASDDLGITASLGSSDTQITLTMDDAGTLGNITSALASVSGVNIIDVTAFTGGTDTPITFLLDEDKDDVTQASPAANTITIGTLDASETDAMAASFLINAINGVAAGRFVYASSGNGEYGDDIGITAAEGSSNTQITLTMDTGGVDGNISSALASVSGVDIVDEEDFTGGGNSNNVDCDANGEIDTCEIESDPSLDCDNNGILDSCQELDDCDENGIPDICDLQDPNNDQNNNGELDDCECIGDITADGIVNIHDLLILIGSWDSANPAADFNFDGIVNIHDLLIFIAAWGPCE